MIFIKQYEDAFKSDWDNFVNNSKTPLFMFNRDFMEYHSDRFEDRSILFFNEDDALIAIMPASSHGDKIISHGGLTYGGIISNNKMKQHTMIDCFTSLKKFYYELGYKCLVYKSIPYIFFEYPAQEDLYALFRNEAKIIKTECSCTIDFSKTIPMPKGRKAQISRAKREGTVIKESTNFDLFIGLENEVLEKYHNNRAVHTGKEMAYLHSKFPNNIKLFTAYDGQDNLVAGSVIFIYKNVVHTQYLAANEWARKNGALDLVIKYMLDKYKTEKMFFDFGISNENNGLFLNEGLMSQKESFGGRTVAYTTWEIDLGNS